MPRFLGSCGKRPVFTRNPGSYSLLVQDEAVEAAARGQPRLRPGEFLSESCENLASDSIQTAQIDLLSVANALQRRRNFAKSGWSAEAGGACLDEKVRCWRGARIYRELGC